MAKQAEQEKAKPAEGETPPPQGIPNHDHHHHDDDDDSCTSPRPCCG